MGRCDYASETTRNTLKRLEGISETSVLASELERVLDGVSSLQELWHYRHVFDRLDEGTVRASIRLITARAKLFVCAAQTGRARELISLLPPDSRCLAQAELLMPGLGWDEFLQHIKLMRERGWLPLEHLTITAGRPAVLNGRWDFFEQWPRMYANADETRCVLRDVLGEDADEVFAIAEVEALYQHDRCYDALVKLVNTLPLLTDSRHNIDVLFPALTFQIFILVINGQAPSTIPLMESLRAQTRRDGACEGWLPNIDALDAWAAMYDGDYARITHWMQECAPDEYAEFCMLDTFRYMIKLRVYLIQGKHLAFISLAARLMPLFESGRRSVDICELNMLWAISDLTRGDEESALSHALISIEIAERCSIERIIADEGERALTVLLLVKRRRGRTPFLTRLIQLTQNVATLYPRYMKEQLPDNPSLSAAEMNVLRLMADGRSNAEIAELMQVTVNTVKAHCKHIAVKLKTSNRQQAVRRAIELGLIRPPYDGNSDIPSL